MSNAQTPQEVHFHGPPPCYLQEEILLMLISSMKSRGWSLRTLSDAIDINKKDNSDFRGQATQDKLGRHSTSVGTDMKEVQAAVSLYAFA